MELTRRQQVVHEETRAVVEHLIIPSRRNVQCTPRALAADVVSIAGGRLQGVESGVERAVVYHKRRILDEAVGIQLIVLMFEEQVTVVLANVPTRRAGGIQWNATGSVVDHIRYDAIAELTACKALDADQGDRIIRVRRQHHWQVAWVDW